MIRTQHIHFCGLGSIPGQGTKILQDAPHSNAPTSPQKVGGYTKGSNIKKGRGGTTKGGSKSEA